MPHILYLIIRKFTPICLSFAIAFLPVSAMAGGDTLSPPSAAKPDCVVRQTSDGKFELVTSGIAPIRKQFVFMNVSCIVGQMLEFTRDLDLKDPIANLTPIIESYLRSVTTEGDNSEVYDLRSIEQHGVGRNTKDSPWMCIS
jgi:hypothetical protein